MAESLQHSPLESVHLSEGARMVPFAGYLMPVQYGSVIAEALAVRQGVGLFDVSHMARLRIQGSDALPYLEHVTTNDVAKLTDHTGQYSLLPNPTGGVVDDIIVYRESEDAFRMVVNASNHAKDVAWLAQHQPISVTLVDETDATGMIAVQGPGAVSLLTGLVDRPEVLTDAPLFGTLDVLIEGIPCFAARSGYTGEDGFELVCAAEQAPPLWHILRNAGAAACGLGARDALRVEAGLPLYGHELTDDLSPIAAGLGWVVSKAKAFIGSEPIQAVREAGPAQRLVGLRLDSRRLPQPGMPVWRDGVEVGTVTSGVYSPVLECGLGLAYVDAAVKFGTPVSLDFRGRAEAATVVNKRFLRSGA